VKKHTNRERFFGFVAQTSDNPLAIEIQRAEGVYLYAENKTYIDCISGISVSNLGHANPSINQALKDQIDKHLHLMVYGEMIQSTQVQLAEKLASYLPENLQSVYFVNSGSEAIEGAMKLAKRYTGRSRFVAQDCAYHGSTHGALSLMSEPYFSNSFAPLLPGIDFIRQNEVSEINKLISTQTAAVFIEPIMGEKGYLPCSVEYLKAVRKRCDETGTLLVFDEIQSGYGRTGSLFAFQELEVVPDILVLAKGFGAGMPLGAFIASNKIMEVLTDNPVLGHITTFGGHPMSCAASLAALNYLHDENIMKDIPAKEQLFRELLIHPKIKKIDGKGLMLALVFDDAQFCRKVIDACVDSGLLIDWFLYAENRIRLSPPLIINNEQIEIVSGIIFENIQRQCNLE
jgi:acetylornithine/succinyldiaminopimelate/putrescine aminotransferase